jgi:DNA-binding winged helix-turn-helix (wHTH) protein
MPLPTLASSPEREEFEELFSPNMIGLGPYSESDARLLLERVGARYERQLDVGTSELLITCTGGHPGILKAAGMALIKGNTNLPENASQTVDTLLGVPDVRSECDKLWNSIGIAEQDVLRSLTDGSTAPHDELPQSLLESKGLIENKKGTFVVFSPLFARYVALSRVVEKASTKIRAGLIRIDTGGEVWVNEEQIVPPLTKKELSLLEYLCLAPGRLRTKDEIVAVVYPNEYQSGESISDDALNALMKRLRDRLEQLSNLGHKIVTVRGKGYRLDIMESHYQNSFPKLSANR